MTIITPFEYQRPKNELEALKLLTAEHKKRRCLILAGGTDLICNLKEDRVEADLLIDIKAVKKLHTLKVTRSKALIGALVTFNELINSPDICQHFPVLMEMAKTVASAAIRNRATLAGNLCSAVPCLDSGPVLLAYDAQLVVHSWNSRGGGSVVERKVPISKWFIGPRKVDLKSNEMVVGIELTAPSAKRPHAGAFLKLGRYRGEDLAQANVTVLITPQPQQAIRIAFGSVGPTPIRAFKIEKFLNQADLTAERIEEALVLVEQEIRPITDVRATKEYRMGMCKVMLKRALLAVLARLVGERNDYGAVHLI